MGNKLRKKEARLERRLEKLAKNKNNIRLSSNITIPDKYIRSSEIPDLSKTPRSISPDNYKNNYFYWTDNHSDLLGNWSWHEPRQWSAAEYNKIKSHMDSHKNNSWGQVEAMTYSGKHKIRKLLNKYQNLSSICCEARNRWLSLKFLSQFEELFRMRLGDKKRIWGIRNQHYFFVVWYERNHQICPIDK